ncbi:DnaJ domain-containing protein, partial [Leptodontidium sp. MPI-SDFR-AT-0119]
SHHHINSVKMPSNNHYQTLGLKRGCKDTEIRSQYRKLALKYHPDKNRSNPNATANFQKILDATEILGDPTKRRAYDRE